MWIIIAFIGGVIVGAIGSIWILAGISDEFPPMGRK
jgi:hypothetical protein